MNLYNLGAWVILSGVLFTLFSYFANNYHDQKRTSLQFLQDFIGGALFMSFIAVLIPDYFPDIYKLILVPTGAITTVSELTQISNSINDSLDIKAENIIEKPETSLISLLPKIGGFMSTKVIDDIQLQLGPIPSSAVRHINI